METVNLTEDLAVDLYEQQTEFLKLWAKDLSMSYSLNSDGSVTLRSGGRIWAKYSKDELTVKNIRVTAND